MPGKKLRVLHVDDQRQWRSIVSDYLVLFGDYEIISAESGEEALNLLSATSFDIIVSDFRMPEMDGTRLLQYIRERGESLPFIFLTGTRYEDLDLDPEKPGDSLYVNKSGDPSQVFSLLSQKICQAVARHKTVQALKKHQIEESGHSPVLPV